MRLGNLIVVITSPSGGRPMGLRIANPSIFFTYIVYRLLTSLWIGGLILYIAYRSPIMQAAHDADHADEMTRRLHEDMAKPATAIPEVYAVKAPEKECVS
jgi:hypothetical protein